MKYLVFDTETTGLPKNYKPHGAKWFKDWPDIVQISWIMYDDELNDIVYVKDYIVKVDGDIPEASSSIHGITNEISQMKGVPVMECLMDFRNSLFECDMIIGHNISFDINVVKAQFLKQGAVDPFLLTKPLDVYCTMKETINVCKIKAWSRRYNKYYYKWPKLIELHQVLFKTTPFGLHNSLTDILVTLRCFYKLKYDKDLHKLSTTFTQLAKDFI